MRTIAIVAIIAIGLPVAIAIGRYGSLQPCDMLVLETIRMRRSEHTVNVLQVSSMVVGRMPRECLGALWRVLTHDPVDVLLECLQTELGDIAKASKPKYGLADKKCNSLGWFLWREEPAHDRRPSTRARAPIRT
jgi:hypothetical protein